MNVVRELIYKDGWLLDPFLEEEHWIWRASIGKYFVAQYGLTLPQVWNLVHGFDKNQVHHCPVCGAELKFTRLDRGFSRTCSKSCGQVKLNQKDTRREQLGSQLNSVASQAKGRYTQFIKSGLSDDMCYLYFAHELDGSYKYGITSNPDQRFCFNCWYNRPHIVCSGNREYIARLEMNIKLALDRVFENFTSEEFCIVKSAIRNTIKNTTQN